MSKTRGFVVLVGWADDATGHEDVTEIRVEASGEVDAILLALAEFDDGGDHPVRVLGALIETPSLVEFAESGGVVFP